MKITELLQDKSKKPSIKAILNYCVYSYLDINKNDLTLGFDNLDLKTAAYFKKETFKKLLYNIFKKNFNVNIIMSDNKDHIIIYGD